MATKKKGLKIREVSKDSEYSGINLNSYPYTRFVVRFNEVVSEKANLLDTYQFALSLIATSLTIHLASYFKNLIYEKLFDQRNCTYMTNFVDRI